MTTGLLLHQNTRLDIDNFLANPSHALIIEGKEGAGKGTIANLLATKLLKISSDRLSNYPNLLKIEAVNNSISINEVREAQKFMKLKTTGQETIRRILMVDKAELMTIEAQNAFLKILEEPPADTVIFILTSQKIKLLPTIRSRAQTFSVKSISKQEIDSFFSNQGYDSGAVTSAYHAASAQVGLMSSLLNDDQDNQQLEELKRAREVLAMSKLQRLVYVDELSKQKESVPLFIKALIITSQAALRQTVANDKMTQAKRWHRTLKLAVEAERKLHSNPNAKLLLTDLLISL